MVEKKQPVRPDMYDDHFFPLVGSIDQLEHCVDCGVHISERFKPCIAAKTKSTPRS